MITDSVSRILQRSRTEAKRYRSIEVRSHHLLLALLWANTGVAIAVINNLQVTIEEIQSAIGSSLPEGGSFSEADILLAILNIAGDEAKALGHPFVGTEHLFLALLRSNLISSTALSKVGITYDLAKAQIIDLMGP